MKRFNEGNDAFIEESTSNLAKMENDGAKNPPEILTHKQNPSKNKDSNNYNPYRHAEVKVRVNGNNVRQGFLENEKIYGKLQQNLKFQ